MPARHAYVYFRHLCAITLLLILLRFSCRYALILLMSCCFADAAATHDAYADAFD